MVQNSGFSSIKCIALNLLFGTMVFEFISLRGGILVF